MHTRRGNCNATEKCSQGFLWLMFLSDDSRRSDLDGEINNRQSKKRPVAGEWALRSPKKLSADVLRPLDRRRVSGLGQAGAQMGRENKRPKGGGSEHLGYSVPNSSWSLDPVENKVKLLFAPQSATGTIKLN